MPPRTALSTSLRGWRCPQCNHRTFTTTARSRAFGPEHPRYIEVPEPPQQTLPYHPIIKGRLPVPRSVFRGKQGLQKANDDQIAQTTQRPRNPPRAPPGSHEEWKRKMSEARRRNLEEGLKGLQARAINRRDRHRIKSETENLERKRLHRAPEREDERLTAPSHGLDLSALLHRGSGPLPDPTREARLKAKSRSLHIHARAKQAERLDHLHSLYMNARSFIVTPAQLDKAIEDEFDKKDFRDGGFIGEGQGSGRSVWTLGPPVTVQNMLNRANGNEGRAVGSGGGKAGGLAAEVNSERVRRIAEKLTGGKMDRVG